MFDLDPDRMMIFYESSDSDWIVLRVALFHYTIFKTDILDLFAICELEIPKWFEELLRWAQGQEYRPIPVAGTPQALPTIQTLIDKIPRRVTPDNAYPLFDGSQWGGIAINPGGVPITVPMPYTASLRDLTYLGLNFWAQSGMLNGALCLVSQALLHYQKSTLTPILHPSLDLTGYYESTTLTGARMYYSPTLRANETCYDATNFAHNHVHYAGGGPYTFDRWFYPDIPGMPDIPNGHFMRPTPDQYNWQVTTNIGGLGAYRLRIGSKLGVGDYDLLVATPFGCVPGWPSDEFLAPLGLYNNDSVGLDSFSSIDKIPGAPCSETLAGGIPSMGQVVVIPEGNTEGSLTGFTETLHGLLVLSQAYNILDSWKNARKLKLYRGEDKRLTVEGEPLTVSGFYLE